MSMTAVIGLGLLAWVLLAIPVALLVARTIRLRDRQRPDTPEPGGSEPGESANPATAFRGRRRWRLRSKT